ncbi:hypothetical protein ONS95_009637 [Cadophora gregata]|uniref:uncharacterized protein n=1 Tax=Cadophora gregata TaxID=51156 RepID=UPI0026DD115F|nr:uncharacterized protein ONS95_009637 [Cadophora gregata]KAK0124693.1 hypothetical protein ONS95_009637 [Cadophora gregata]KAK0129447.1 hypothetical protein ONS96_000019 [Cadophora gregata f. sp. sojae]
MPDLGWVKDFELNARENYSGASAQKARDFFGIKLGDKKMTLLPNLHQDDFPEPSDQEMQVWSTKFDPDSVDTARKAYEIALEYQDLYNKAQYLRRKVPTLDLKKMTDYGGPAPLEREMDEIWENGIEEGHPTPEAFFRDSTKCARIAKSPVMLVDGIPSILLASITLVRIPAMTYLANVIGRSKCHKQNFLDAKARIIELEDQEDRGRHRKAKIKQLLEQEKANKKIQPADSVQSTRSPSPAYLEIPEYSDALKPATLEEMEAYRLKHYPEVGKRIWRKFCKGSLVVEAFQKPAMIRKKKVKDFLAKYLIENPVDKAREDETPKRPTLPEGVRWHTDLTKEESQHYHDSQRYWYVNTMSRSLEQYIKICEGFMAYPQKADPDLDVESYAVIAANTILAFRPACFNATSAQAVEEEVTRVLAQIHTEMEAENPLTWESPTPTWLTERIMQLDAQPSPYPPTPDLAQISNIGDLVSWTTEDLPRLGYFFDDYLTPAEDTQESEHQTQDVVQIPSPRLQKTRPYSSRLGDISDYEYDMTADCVSSDDTDEREDSDFKSHRGGLVDIAVTGSSQHSTDDDTEQYRSALRNLDLQVEDIQVVLEDPSYILFHKNLAVVYNSLKNGNIPTFAKKMDKYALRIPLRKLLTILKFKTETLYREEESVQTQVSRILKSTWKDLHVTVKDMTQGVWMYTFYLWVQSLVIRKHSRLPSHHGNHIEPAMWRCQIFAAVYQQYAASVTKLLGKDALISNPSENDGDPRRSDYEVVKAKLPEPTIVHLSDEDEVADGPVKKVDQKRPREKESQAGGAGGTEQGQPPLKKQKVQSEKTELTQAIKNGTPPKPNPPGTKVSSVIPSQTALKPHTPKHKADVVADSDLDLGDVDALMANMTELHSGHGEDD